VREIAVEFENEGQKIYGMVHLPAGNSKHPCLVFLHGYTGDRIEDHCLFVKAARDLCEHGIACLRFDFRGSGESQGKFADITVEGEIGDALRAVEFLGTLSSLDMDRLGLVGLGLGGCVAACIAAKVKPKSLALWAPSAFVDYMVERGGRVVKDPYAWLPENFKNAVKRQGHVDIGGFVRGKAYFESLKHVDPLREIAKYQGPVLIAQGSEDEVTLPINSEFLYDHVRGRRLLVVVDGADHTFSATVWENQVIETTRLWFAETL
jgi:cephalosporin-C deacetylase-like acetyl esterase